MVQVRLIEGRFAVCTFDDTFSVREVARMRSDIIEMFSSITGKVVMFSDLRSVHMLRPEVKGPLTSVLQVDNPRIERNAIVVNRAVPFAIQAHNIIKEAESRARRIFTDRDEAGAWLAEVLNDQERAALDRVLAIQA